MLPAVATSSNTSGPLSFDRSGTVSGSYTIQAAKDGEWVNVDFFPASEFE